MNTLDLKIGDMHCEGCAERLQTLLGKTPGVRRVTVSYKTGSGTVSYRAQTIGEKQIIAVVEDAGFSAEKD